MYLLRLKKWGPKSSVVTLLSDKDNPFRPFQRNFWEVHHFERQKEYLQTCRAYASITGQFIFPKHKQQMDKAGELTEASLSLGSIIADYDK